MDGPEIAQTNMGLVILITALLAASLKDLSQQRIPNLITFPLAACGLIYYVASAGTSGLIFASTGILAGAALLLPFYALGWMGAGDVKLLAASGSILGPAGVFTAALYTALAGGFYALLVLWRHGVLKGVMYGPATATHDRNAAAAGKRELPKLCYGVAISLGTVLAVLRPL